jgi:hypothetical protein
LAASGFAVENIGQLHAFRPRLHRSAAGDRGHGQVRSAPRKAERQSRPRGPPELQRHRGAAGRDLPKGAREKKSWWTKEESGHASAWLEAGYEADVDLDAQTVVYRKAAVEAPAKGAGLAHARELVDTGVDQAKDLFSSGAGQLRDAFGKAAPRAKRAAPWVVLGGVAIGLVGLLARGSSKDRA